MAHSEQENKEITPIEDETEAWFALHKACERGATVHDIKKIIGEEEEITEKEFNQDILNFLLTNDTVSLTELAEHTGKSKKSLQRKLSKYKKPGIRDDKRQTCYPPIKAFDDHKKYIRFFLCRDKRRLSRPPTITIKKPHKLPDSAHNTYTNYARKIN